MKFRLFHPCRKYHIFTHFVAASLDCKAPVCDFPSPNTTGWLQGYAFKRCERCGHVEEETR